MCVIIAKNPGVVIPAEKIESACLVNPDGWGLSIVDRGRVETVRRYDVKGNDPDTVNKVLEELAEFKVYLHLRFATMGTKNEANCHPYYAYKDDEYQCSFMHNGTLSQDFGNKDCSDSRDFAERILNPLLDASLSTTSNPLREFYIQDILERYAGVSSKFVLIDNTGDDLIINEDSGTWHTYGEEHKAWWSSNVYSFQRTHRSSYSSTYSPTSRSYRWDAKQQKMVEEPIKEVKQNNAHPTSGTTTASTTTTETSKQMVVVTPGTPIQTNPVSVPAVSSNVTPSVKDASTETPSTENKEANDVDSRVSFPKREKADPEMRVSFCDLAGYETLDEICDLTPDQIEEIIEDTEVAKVLFNDLIYALYQMNVKWS